MMVVDDKRRARGDRARAQILECSAALASIEGLDGLSLGRIAQAAGVGKGNIQVLFGDKEALQLATLDRAMELFRVAVVEPALKELTPVGQLRALVEGWFSFVEKRTLPGGCFINAVSSEYRGKAGRVRDRIVEYRAAGRARFCTLVSDAKNMGAIRPDVDAEELAFLLISFQASANVSAFLGDRDQFERARRASQASIDAVLQPVAVEGT
jgi:AcrR family transcriptional regulator